MKIIEPLCSCTFEIRIMWHEMVAANAPYPLLSHLEIPFSSRDAMLL